MAPGRTTAILTAAAALILLVPAVSIAGSYAGYVTAQSRYGNGVIRAPVREAQFGRQVKLPGGTWLYCERSGLFSDRHRPCSETLRRETLDFWETLSEESGGPR